MLSLLYLIFATLTAASLEQGAFGMSTNGYVYPRIIESRSSDGQLELMINDITLNLEKVAPFADTFHVVCENEGTSRVEERNTDSLSGETYKDPKNQAAVIISRENGLRVRGLIQGNWMIDHDDEAVVTDGLVRHRLTARKATAGAEYYDYLGDYVKGFHPLIRNFKGLTASLSERSSQYSGPKYVTVETTIVVGQKYVADFKKSKRSPVEEVIDYLAVLMALVNLVFEDFESRILNLQLSVVSVVFLKKDSETFLEAIPPKKEAIKTSTLSNFNAFVEKRKDVLGKQDIVLYISNYSIHSGGASQSPSHIAAGYATVGGACTKNHGCLVKDNPKTFEGVYAIAHEALHLMGVVHDGQGAPDYLPNSPGARECYYHANTVMAPVTQHGVKLSLSVCTQRQVTAYLQSKRGSCLLSPAKRSARRLNKKNIRDVLLNTAQFCKELVPETKGVKFVKELNENINIRSCKAVCKWEDGKYIRYRYNNAPDLTLCGENGEGDVKVCLHGKCIELRNPLPSFPKHVKKTL